MTRDRGRLLLVDDPGPEAVAHVRGERVDRALVGVEAERVPAAFRKPERRVEPRAKCRRLSFETHRSRLIAPVIVVICAIGAYTVHNNMFDVVMMLVFGVVGYVLKKCNYPLAPLVLAIVLGDKAEEAFRQSLLSSQGSLGIFVSNGLVSSIMALGLIALFWPLIQNAFTRLRTRPAV